MSMLFLLACKAADTPAGTFDTVVSGVDTADPVETLPDLVPGTSFFVDDTVHALTIALDATAWDALVAAPTTYVEATFSDGDATLPVGVRLKGFSSFQPLTGKPNFRVSFDHFVEGQRYDGLEAVDLVSEAEDPAAMSEALAYRLFRAAGLPASRTGFAHLSVNDLDYGLYTLVEKKDDVLVERLWPDDDHGSLYESSSEHWPCDLDDGGAPRCDCWELDEAGTDTRADLESLCSVATDTPNDAWYAAIRDAVDWDDVSGHIGMEIVLDAYDHYAGYMGNTYLYHRPDAEAWSLLPASMNSVFGSSRYVAGSCGAAGHAPTDFTGGLLAERCWADEACTADLYAAIRRDVDVVATSDVLSTIDAWEALLGPYAVADPRRGYTEADFTTQVACIRDWLAARAAELSPYLPVECLGEGGNLDVTGWGDLSTNGSCDRDAPDAVGYAVESLVGARVTLAEAPVGIAAGDEVLVLVAQSADGAGVGEHAFAMVTAVEADALVLDPAPDLPDGSILLQRVPTYEEVTVRAGATLTVGAWNGATGGVLAFRARTLTIEDGGSVSASGLGYAGGATGGSYNVDGYQGESVAGLGIGGASSAESYNEANGAWAANRGGGGCNIAGGGGEHAGGATGAPSWNDVATPAAPGETYGDASGFFFGSGGGGVVNLGAGAGPGGAGGGVLYVAADTIVAEGERALVANGADAGAWSAGTWSYGAGGGAGGTVWIEVGTLDAPEGAIAAEGGAGYAGVDRPGGDGGEGRVVVE